MTTKLHNLKRKVHYMPIVYGWIWAPCCSDDRSETIIKNGNHSSDMSKVTCQHCLTAAKRKGHAA